MKENIRQSNPFGVGDSAIQSKLATFLEKISEVGQSHHYCITYVGTFWLSKVFSHFSWSVHSGGWQVDPFDLKHKKQTPQQE